MGIRCSNYGQSRESDLFTQEIYILCKRANVEVNRARINSLRGTRHIPPILSDFVSKAGKKKIRWDFLIKMDGFF